MSNSNLTNADIARVFAECADLLEIDGADSFRVSSYRRVARCINDLPTDVREIAVRGELARLEGVGKSSAQKIQTLLDTGALPLRVELAQKVPETLLELLHIPGMGPKKVAQLWREVGVLSLESLAAAIDAGRLEGLKGFGARSVEKILEGIAFLKRIGGRTRLGEAAPVAERFRAAVAELPGVARAEIAGSLRRGCETIGDLDLLCVADDGAAVIGHFTKLPGVTRVLVAGDTKGSVLVERAAEREIQIDLRVVPAESFGAAWQYFTGSKEHNVRLRELAVRRGWTLNEYALSDASSGKAIASRSEEDIYAALGLPCLPPELREDRGEFELKEAPRDLVALEDVRGDLHLHTDASDGKHTLEQMVAAAQERGYEYIAVTDHSQASVVANGLDRERLLRHIDAIHKLNERTRGLTVWAGAEVDIMADGSLDYEDDLLAQLDWVVASNHYHLGRDGDKNTERALAALRNPHVNVLAHPTGRMINRRDAAPLDIGALCAEAARTGAALEINASGSRLDLKDTHARLAAQAGALLCINCDAHATDQLDKMRYGVITARRGWVRRQDVLNTRSAKQVEAFVRAKRTQGR